MDPLTRPMSTKIQTQRDSFCFRVVYCCCWWWWRRQCLPGFLLLFSFCSLFSFLLSLLVCVCVCFVLLVFVKRSLIVCVLACSSFHVWDTLLMMVLLVAPLAFPSTPMCHHVPSINSCRLHCQYRHIESIIYRIFKNIYVIPE